MSRTLGSKNKPRATSCSQCNSGGAASAAKYRRNGGVADRSNTHCYIPGEGWVNYMDIKRAVATAYEQWRIRRAMAGQKIWDGWEAISSDIEESKARRATQ